MKIWHAGISSGPLSVDGVVRTVWLLSSEQALAGCDVTLLVDGDPNPSMTEAAKALGVGICFVRSGAWGYSSTVRELVDRDPPDIVHMHSVFILRQGLLARVLRRAGVPYVITPHGGLAPGVLHRGRLRKSIYSGLIERARFRGAAAIALVTPDEESVVKTFLRGFARPMVWMPNPVDAMSLREVPWGGAAGDPKRLTFLGRFDVMAKGIDVLIEIGRLLPEVRFELYGSEHRRTLAWLDRLRADLPPNIRINAPIFGDDKVQALAESTMYIQSARWEGFPVSVAEAMSMGVPTAISDVLAMTPLFRKNRLGLVIPLDPQRAAELIRNALADEDALNEWSARGRKFATRFFEPRAAAHRHIRLYECVIDGETKNLALALDVQDATEGERTSQQIRDVDPGCPANSYSSL